MTKTTGGKKRRKDPIYEKIKNGEPFSPDEAKNLVDLELQNEIKNTQWVANDASTAMKLKSRFSSVFLAHFIKARDYKEDMIDTLLSDQMAAIHGTGMECIRRAAYPGNSDATVARYLSAAVKCLSAFARHVEVLDKHRGKGQQRITVQHQHVNVQPGGQAAIANFGDGTPQAVEELKESLQQVARSAEQPFTIDGDQPELAPQPVKRAVENDSQA
jgi:hypothetical protein